MGGSTSYQRYVNPSKTNGPVRFLSARSALFPFVFHVLVVPPPGRPVRTIYSLPSCSIQVFFFRMNTTRKKKDSRVVIFFFSLSLFLSSFNFHASTHNRFSRPLAAGMGVDASFSLTRRVSKLSTAVILFILFLYAEICKLLWLIYRVSLSNFFFLSLHFLFLFF